MSWVAFVDDTGRCLYDLNPFVPDGAKIISAHVLIADARDAVEKYREQQRREVLAAAGQKELDFA